MHEGELITTLTSPTRMDRDNRVVVITVMTEVGWCKWLLIAGMGKSRSCGIIQMFVNYNIEMKLSASTTFNMNR